MNKPSRLAQIERVTKETKIITEINLDGNGSYDIKTGIGFFDHMLEQLSRHSLIDIYLRAEGDLDITQHHTVEDTGIVLGEALAKALGNRKGICRYGSAIVPMDETLSSVAIDLSNRPYLIWLVDFPRSSLDDMDTEHFKEWFQAFSQSGGATLHVQNMYGDNSHHIIESCFKALARALRESIETDPRSAEMIPSTKGTLGGKN
tara:strand:+ start:113280 stop:113891 length:612 start_codon:yes stop_codon:yes gene_type:complete